MTFDEMQNQDQTKEEDFDDEKEDDDRCSCCRLPFDQCSWGKPDEWDDNEQTDDDNSQINDPNYTIEQDEYSYSDSNSEF